MIGIGVNVGVQVGVVVGVIVGVNVGILVRVGRFVTVGTILGVGGGVTVGTVEGVIAGVKLGVTDGVRLGKNVRVTAKLRDGRRNDKRGAILACVVTAGTVRSAGVLTTIPGTTVNGARPPENGERVEVLARGVSTYDIAGVVLGVVNVPA